MESSKHRQRKAPDTWRELVSTWYPDMATKTYVVPPVHFNRVTYRDVVVSGSGQKALVLCQPEDLKKGASACDKCAPTGDMGAPTVDKGAPMFDKSALTCDNGVPKGHKDASTRDTGHVLPESSLPLTGKKQKKSKKKKKNKNTKQKVIQATDFQDDCAQKHVIKNLHALGETNKEAMFILSQLKFSEYLNKEWHQEDVKRCGLLLPKDLDTEEVPYSRGEADFLVLHSRRGVLIGEIKSVGKSQYLTPNTCQFDEKVADRISESIQQLDKSEYVVSHLVSDIALGLTVRKTLFLPYLRQDQLRLVLGSKTLLNEGLCKCLGASDLSEAVDLCVCAEQLSDPDTYWDVTPAVLSRLSSWWRVRMATDDPLLFDDDTLYPDIVARFVGPASTVSVYTRGPSRLEVRTAGQAVAELGRRLSRLVLTPQQLEILSNDPPRVCISGPPGTGKTVLLVQQGLRRLREGKDVHVISTDYDTLAASCFIQHQLNMTLEPEAASEARLPVNTLGLVFVHHYHFKQEAENDVDRAIQELRTAVRDESSWTNLPSTRMLKPVPDACAC